MYISYPNKNISVNTMFLMSSGQKKEGKKVKSMQFRFPDETAEGTVETMEIREGINLTISDFIFYKDTVMYEEVQTGKVFQLSFCIDGGFKWCYMNKGKKYHFNLSAQQSQVRYGQIENCESIFQGGRRCRCVSITLDKQIFGAIFSAVCIRDALCGTEKEEKENKVYLYTPNISKLLSEIIECPFCEELKKIYVEGKILELIAVFCEEVICQSPVNRLGIPIKESDYEALLGAREYINKNFAHPLTLSVIAKEAAISEKKLSSSFKQCFGSTVNEYITEKRMETAKELLLKGQYTVSSVTWMVGYSHTSYFIRTFREHYGITPGEMLKSNK